jgi:hypothetical protein
MNLNLKLALEWKGEKLVGNLRQGYLSGVFDGFIVFDLYEESCLGTDFQFHT